MNKLEIGSSTDPIIREIRKIGFNSSCFIEELEYNEAAYSTRRPRYSIKMSGFQNRFNVLMRDQLEKIGLNFEACYTIDGALWVDLDYNPTGAP